jgi:hypothetical protein
VIEWLLRELPAGGIAPERKEWSEEGTAAIANDFFASPFGIPFDRADERELLDSVLWFGTDYVTGDPLQWSAVTVEMLLADWFPRKVVAKAAFLSKLPAVLRAYIRYCHGQRGIRAALTTDTLAAVDHFEPEYQRTIRSSRPQGPQALLNAMFDARAAAENDFDEDDDYLDDLDDLELAAIMLESLDRKVGGRIQLQNLDDRPLPDEPFEWAGIPEDIHPIVGQMLESCDRCADELLDVEHRTAMRRFLSRAAVGDPAVFRRKSSPVRGAAAVAWVICRANESTGSWSGLTVQDLLAWFGLKGSVTQRAAPLLRANGVDPYHLYGVMALGAPDLLTSAARATIIAKRHRWMDDPEPPTGA